MRGGAANKEVIKHLFLRRNKKEREKHAHAHTLAHTYTLWSVCAPAAEALRGSHLD